MPYASGGEPLAFRSFVWLALEPITKADVTVDEG